MQVNKHMLRRLALFFSFLLVLVNLSFVQPQISSAQNLDKAVTITAIDNEGQNVVPTAAVEIEDGDTAWDVLEHVADDLDYEEFDFGNMLHGINGVVADFDTYGHFWNFIVNGEMAQVGASSYEVNHGDNILFLLTDNAGSTEVEVSALDEAGNAIMEQSVEITASSTAYDAIVQAAKKQEINLDVSIHSDFYTFINNIGDQELADNQFWQILLNDEALQVGVLSHQVQPGEHIQLRLESFDAGDDSEGDADDSDEEDGSDEGEGSDGGSNEGDGSDGESEETEEEKDVDENEREQENDADKETEEETDNAPPEETVEQVSEEIDFLANYVLDNGLATDKGDEDWVWALAIAGYDVPESYVESVEAFLNDNNEFGSVNELSKVIIALSSAGADASNIAGHNLIEELANLKAPDALFINEAIFSSIAINSGDYSVDQEMEAGIVQSILDAKLGNGGWNWYGSTPSYDLTAMALNGLAPYQDNPDVKEAIDQTIALLAKEQDSNGGYDEEYVGFSSATAAQVIIGLVSVGVEPTSTDFTKEDANLLEFMLQYKTEDGLYKNLIEDEQPDLAFATPQVFLALAYYKNFIGLDESEATKPEVPGGTPEPEPEEPEPKEPKPKEPKPNPENGEKPSKESDDENDENIIEKVEPKPEVEGEMDSLEDDNGSAKTDEISDGNAEIDTGEKLPNTKTDIFNMLGIGIIVLAAGFVLLTLQRKWREQ